MKNNIIYNGEWGVQYDPIKKEMIAGYSLDGVTFSPEFRITEIEEVNIIDAIEMCSILYSSYGLIIASYKELLEEYKKTH